MVLTYPRLDREGWMRRRTFIAALGGAAAWPLVARAQQHPKVRRIGFLGLAPEFSGVDALQAGLRDLGYVEGSNIAIDWRWAERVDQLPELAADLVRMNVDVIVAHVCRGSTTSHQDNSYRFYRPR
jgi:putative tryptophan/tyrosine transport system substrate-binding protein